MENITDIFFDLDHTLWDFEKNSALAFDKVFKQFFPTIDSVQFVKIFSPINDRLWKLYQVDKITRKELRYERLKQTFEIMGVLISDDEIDFISEKYIEYLPQNNHLLEGTFEILEYLFLKYNLHIISNGLAPVQKKKIDNSGLRSYFKTITFSEMVGVKKPNKLIFEHALNSANTYKENAVMIGDCIEADFYGAIDFGMKAILLDSSQNYKEIEIPMITHLSQLKTIF